MGMGMGMVKLRKRRLRPSRDEGWAIGNSDGH